MLRFAEELLLLQVGERWEAIGPGHGPPALRIALAGAVLMDLALEDRIDTDLEGLVLVDSTPVGDELLDPTLAAIAADTRTRGTRHWLARTAEHSGDILDTALKRLTASGILESDAERSFFLSRRVSRIGRYQTKDGTAEESVRLRIMRVLFGDEIPDPREIVIICLADACGIFASILSSDELEEARERIALIRGLDLIGRSLAEVVRELGAEPEAEAEAPAAEIPRARGLPIAGNALSMGGDMRAFLLRQFRELGPVFRLQAFKYPLVVLAGPDANVFAKHDNRCLRSHDIWKDFDGAMGARHSPLSADGTVHTQMRRDHAQIYSRKLLAKENAIPDATSIVRQEIRAWPMQEPLGALYTFQRIITEQIGFLATGASSMEYIDDIIHFSSMMISTKVSRHVPKLYLRLPRFRRARQRVEELVRNIVAAHAPEKRGDRPRSFVDDVLELNQKDPHYISEAEFLLFLLGPFIAGLDTAASVCAFMTYELAKHPEVRERAVAEADALFEGREAPTLESLGKLDVIHRVAMETMRLYPISPVLPRTAANAFRFQDYAVPAGETVLIAHTVPHMMEEYYPDPHRFDIDRYLPERGEHRRAGVYAPFGLGPHQCLGRSLAETLMAINMACILHEAEFELHPPAYRLKTVPMPGLHPHRSLRFRVVGRRQAA